MTHAEFWKLTRAERRAILDDPELPIDDFLKYMRDDQPDNDLAGDIWREENYNASVRAGEKERYGL